MNRLHKHVMALLLAATPVASVSQAPRVQTSAPAEKTAVTTTNVSAAKKPAAPRPDKPRKEAQSFDRFMAVKTNVAYDAIALLNLAYEVQVAPRWSLEVPVIWSLWDWDNDKGLRTVTLQPGVKYHFSEPGKGHAVGADIIAGWFNMRHKETRYQDTGRPMLGASLNYSYSLPLSRGWAVEFALGVGYVNMTYNTYYNIDNGAWISKETRNYFGPTRIGISLSYKL